MIKDAIIVLDIGKTVAKISLWTHEGELVERASRPNSSVALISRTGDPYPALDVAGIGEWLIERLAQFARRGEIAHIIPIAHGAALAILREGRLALPPMDYEAKIPAKVLELYRAGRDAFALNGSPALPDGLNLGAQLHWLEELVPGCLDGAICLPWPQYWAWFLSGVARAEVSSLGCHTDLWSPATEDFSPMAKRRGWAAKLAPIAFAGAAIGMLRPDLARQTGISPKAKIHCGIHDSNAALIAARGFSDLDQREATILSTGTWFVAMRVPRSGVPIPGLVAERDCLINVDAWRQACPSARWMGGREIALAIGEPGFDVDLPEHQGRLCEAAVTALAQCLIPIPSFAPGSGPFPQKPSDWQINARNIPNDPILRAACACLYAALVTDASLELIDSHNKILVEGRFARADLFVRALAALRPDDQILVANTDFDASFGALRLVFPALRPAGDLRQRAPIEFDLRSYRRYWHNQLAKTMG